MSNDPTLQPVDATTILGMPIPTEAYTNGSPTYEPKPTLDHDVITALDTMKAGIDGVHSLVKSHIDQQLVDLQSEVNNAHNLIVGNIDRGLDQITPPLAKAHGKVQKQVNQNLSEAYGYANAAGVIYPQPDQVAYGLSTGDYLGSVGLSLPTHSEVPASVVAAGVVNGVQPPDAMVAIAQQQAQQAQQAANPPFVMPLPNQTPQAAVTHTSQSPIGQNVPGVDLVRGFVQQCESSGGTIVNDRCVTPAPAITIPGQPQLGVTIGSGPVGQPQQPQPPQQQTPPPPPPLPPGFGSSGFSCPAPIVECPSPPSITVNVPAPVVNITVPTSTPTTPPTGSTGGGGITVGGTGGGTTGPTECLYGQTVTGGPDGEIITCNPPPPPCPPPPPPPPPVVNTGGTLIGAIYSAWNSITKCAAPDIEGSSLNPVTGTLFGFRGEPDSAPQWFTDAFGSSGIGRDLLHGVMTVIDQGITGYLKFVAGTMSCDFGSAMQALLMTWKAGLANRMAGGAIDKFQKGMDYATSSICPQEIPTADGATEAYLGGAISHDMWACWQEANNQLPTPASTLLFARRTKPSLLETIKLWRWGQIGDADFQAYANQNGVIRIDDLSAIVKANEQIPGPSDLMRFMTRDVADHNVVKGYQLDQDFAAKWTGTLRQWGLAQGLTDEIALAHWEAHWQYPSYTQAAEMFHRLRPDKYPDDAALPVEQRKHVTTQDDFLTLLGVNDMAPWWRQRMVDVSYRVMTRMDARRSFAAGQMQFQDQVGVYLDEGYSPVDANRLAQADQLNARTQFARSVEGGIGEKYCRMYIKGLITEAELRQRLGALIPNGRIVDGKVVRCQFEIKVNRRNSIWGCLKTELRSGQITQAQAVQYLNEQGFDPNVASALVDEFTCSRLPRMKMLSAQQLCTLATMGLISQASHIERLQNLGWSNTDAASVAQICTMNALQKSQQATQKQTKAAQAAALKAAKRAQKEEIRKCKLAQAAAQGKQPTCAEQQPTLE